MSSQMTDPHLGLISFQEALSNGIVQVDRVRGFDHLYSHFDIPAPGVKRFTYVRLSDDKKKVLATCACVMNGTVGSAPCTALGYAVAQDERGKGLAKRLLADTINDQWQQAAKAGLKALAFEAMIDVSNVSSLRVAESVFGSQREELIDQFSKVPAYRYTMVVSTKDGQRLEEAESST